MSKDLEYIKNKYDINNEYTSEINLDFDYESTNITAIIGGSGTGKSTLLRKWFNDEADDFIVNIMTYHRLDPVFTIINDLVQDEEKTSKLLFDVGLSSVPIWMNTYDSLSNGEKLRFEIAYKIACKDELIYVDEFTSMLDRQVAMNLCYNLSKILQQYNKQLVIATCHFDILDWLRVDRVIDTNLKKSLTHESSQHMTLEKLRLELYREICGDYLATITI